MAPPDARPCRFFADAAAFRAWLEEHHASAAELWVGFYRKGSGRPSITWPESVDEALCVGWIDGLRQSVDGISYRIRFSPRRPNSVWSAVNVRRVTTLRRRGLLRPAGEAAFAARRENRSGGYSYEQRPAGLPPEYAARLAENEAAQADFDSRPPSYRRAVAWWILSAKREETRLRRLQQLIDCSAQKRMVPPMIVGKKPA